VIRLVYLTIKDTKQKAAYATLPNFYKKNLIKRNVKWSFAMLNSTKEMIIGHVSGSSCRREEKD